jgi:flavin-dependent dehydrogenase
MNNVYDLIVVGAGPAGLTAAKVAGENGLSVAVLERKDVMHDILRMCGMMLVTLSGKYMGERVTHNEKEGLLCFPHHGFNLKYDGPTKDFFSWEIHSPGGEKLVFGDYSANIQKGKAGRASAVYSKSRLLASLVEECKRLGVHFFTGENVIDAQKSGEKVEIVTAGGKHFKGVFAIAADGRQSRIARTMGMNKNRGFYTSITSLGYEMTNLDLAHPDALHQPLFKSGDPPMMGFIIPRACDYEGEDVWLVMISNVNMQADHEGIFDAFTQQSRFAPWFKGARKVRKCGCTGNMYAPLFHPFKDNVLFVGDAGWCQEAEMTGAVMSGWKAGNSVAFAMQEKKYSEEGIQPYLEWWKTYYLDKMDYNIFLKNLYMPILCTEDEIDYLFKTIKETLPTALDPYEIPAHMGSAMAKIIPTIKEEKPDLLQKIEKFGALPPEFVLRNTKRSGFPCNFTI